MTYQSALSEKFSIKRLRYSLGLVELDVYLISLGVIFHNFISRNIRVFWHFHFEHRGSTILLFTLVLVSCSCAIIWLSTSRVKCSCLSSQKIVYTLYRTKWSFTPLNWINLELISISTADICCTFDTRINWRKYRHLVVKMNFTSEIHRMKMLYMQT